MNQTLIYLDPGYLDQVGHYTRMGELVRDESKNRDIALRHLVSRNIPDALAHERGLEPLFACLASIDNINNSRAALTDFSEKLDRLLGGIEYDKNAPPHDYKVFMYTAHPLHLPILAHLLNKHRARIGSLEIFACLFYIDANVAGDDNQSEYLALLERVSCLLERFDPGRRLRLCADSERTSTLFKPHFARDITILPLPIGATKTNGRKQEKIHLGYLGSTILRNGYPFFYEAYKKMVDLPAFRDVQFMVKHTSIGSLTDIHEQFLSETRNIEHFDGFMQTEELDTFIAACDVILLPYSKKLYPFQSSGLVPDALHSDKLMVVPADTWMSDQVMACSAGETFRSDDLGSFIEATTKIVANLEDYRQGVDAAALSAFKSRHSAPALFDALRLNGGEADINDIDDPMPDSPDIGMLLSEHLALTQDARKHRRGSRQDRERLETRLLARDTSLAEKRKALVKTEAVLEKTENRLSAAKDRLTRREDQIRVTRSGLRDARLSAKRARKRVAGMQGSLSWRVTAPMRRFLRLVKR